MNAVVLILFVIGLALLISGAELLVRGAARLASLSGISSLVIGLTVVAFGTSAPELAVSIQSALSGQAGADIALGNVVGSNIFNVLFILGVSAAVAPLVVSHRLVRIDVPVMIGVSVLAFWLATDGAISRWNGFLLTAGIIAYTLFLVLQGRRAANPIQNEQAQAAGQSDRDHGHVTRDLALVLAGLAMLVAGSNWLVDGAIAIAGALGVSDLVIGLTIVAAGTSLPEVATSVIASMKGERDIAVGNVVGSNIFNILAVLGLAALAAPDGISVAPQMLNFDMPVMIAVAVACLPIFFTGHAIDRWEAIVFLGYYAAYTAFLILAAESHEMLGAFSNAMLLFAVPLTVITLLIAVMRQLRRHPH